MTIPTVSMVQPQSDVTARTPLSKPVPTKLNPALPATLSAKPPAQNTNTTHHAQEIQNQQIVYEFDKTSKQIWLNIVDKSSGRVLVKLPPQVVRQMIDTYSSMTGLPFDKKS